MEEKKQRRHRHTCEGVVDLLCDYLEGDLPSDEEKDLGIHMEDCPPCVAFLNTYRKTSEVCRLLSPEDIPPELRERLEKFLKESQKKRRG